MKKIYYLAQQKQEELAKKREEVQNLIKKSEEDQKAFAEQEVCRIYVFFYFFHFSFFIFVNFYIVSVNFCNRIIFFYEYLK